MNSAQRGDTDEALDGLGAVPTDLAQLLARNLGEAPLTIAEADRLLAELAQHASAIAAPARPAQALPATLPRATLPQVAAHSRVGTAGSPPTAAASTRTDALKQARPPQRSTANTLPGIALPEVEKRAPDDEPERETEPFARIATAADAAYDRERDVEPEAGVIAGAGNTLRTHAAAPQADAESTRASAEAGATASEGAAAQSLAEPIGSPTAPQPQAEPAHARGLVDVGDEQPETVPRLDAAAFIQAAPRQVSAMPADESASGSRARADTRDLGGSMRPRPRPSIPSLRPPPPPPVALRDPDADALPSRAAPRDQPEMVARARADTRDMHGPQSRKPFARGLSGVEDLPDISVGRPAPMQRPPDEPEASPVPSAPAAPAANASAANNEGDSFEFLVDEEILELDADDGIIMEDDES